MIKNSNFEKVKVVLETSPRMKSKDISKITNLSVVTISRILKEIENNYTFKNVTLAKRELKHETTQEGESSFIL